MDTKQIPFVAKLCYFAPVNKTVLVGLFLTLLGAVLLLIGIKGYQKQEELFRVGEYFSASATTTKTVPAFRYVGSGCIGGGIILMLMASSKRK